jgi:hypothetical protein
VTVKQVGNIPRVGSTHTVTLICTAINDTNGAPVVTRRLLNQLVGFMTRVTNITFIVINERCALLKVYYYTKLLDLVTRITRISSSQRRHVGRCF